MHEFYAIFNFERIKGHQISNLHHALFLDVVTSFEVVMRVNAQCNNKEIPARTNTFSHVLISYNGDWNQLIGLSLSLNQVNKGCY